jgi:hypothetical protein
MFSPILKRPTFCFSQYSLLFLGDRPLARLSRLHFFTLTVFMFIAGALIWQNLIVREPTVIRLSLDHPIAGYGWPMFSTFYTPQPVAPNGLAFIEHWSWRGVLIDILVAFAILGVGTLISEISIRKIVPLKRRGG